MTNPQTKFELIAALEDLHTGLADTIATMSLTDFERAGTDDRWSPKDYLKHILLSVKPIVKALEMSADKVRKLFPVAEGSSRAYADIVTAYAAGLARGVRAEDQPSVLPISYRLPDDMGDEQTYLRGQWDDALLRLLAALDSWSDHDLDTAQLPHPAIGLITMREMLLFTVYHTTMHWNDMRGIHL